MVQSAVSCIYNIYITESKDNVAKFKGMFSSKHVFNDRLVALPEEKQRDTTGWDDKAMSEATL